MNYEAVKKKLNSRHDPDLVAHEEKCLNDTLAAMSPEQLQDLQTPIWLVAASPSAGSANNKIQVSKKIRLMVKLVDDLLKADETQTEIKLFISFDHLKLVVNYCNAFSYIKIKSTIFFPALY